MYDSIYIEVKCPKCGHESMMECQTKDLDCGLNEYSKGDFILSKKILTEITESKKIHCIAECESEDCRKELKNLKGDNSSRGNFFKIFIILRGGIVTGEYQNIYEA